MPHAHSDQWQRHHHHSHVTESMVGTMFGLTLVLAMSALPGSVVVGVLTVMVIAIVAVMKAHRI